MVYHWATFIALLLLFKILRQDLTKLYRLASNLWSSHLSLPSCFTAVHHCMQLKGSLHCMWIYNYQNMKNSVKGWGNSSVGLPHMHKALDSIPSMGGKIQLKKKSICLSSKRHLWSQALYWISKTKNPHQQRNGNEMRNSKVTETTTEKPRELEARSCAQLNLEVICSRSSDPEHFPFCSKFPSLA